MPDLSYAAIERRITDLREALDEIKTIDTDLLEGVDWLDHRLFHDTILAWGAPPVPYVR